MINKLDTLKTQLEQTKSHIQLMEDKTAVEVSHGQSNFKPSTPVKFHNRKNKKALALWIFQLNNME